jgi:hypothetical protein
VGEAELTEMAGDAADDAEPERVFDAGCHGFERFFGELGEGPNRELASEHGRLAQQSSRRFSECIEMPLDRTLEVDDRQRLQQLRPRVGVFYRRARR